MLEIREGPQFLRDYLVTSFRLDQAVGEIGSLEIGLSPRAGGIQDLFARLGALQADIGQSLRATIGEWAFAGTIHGVAYREVDQAYVVSIRDPLGQLDDLHGSRVYSSQTIREIVSSNTLVLGDYQFVDGTADVRPSLAIRYQESSIDFVGTLLADHGGAIWCQGDRVVVGAAANAQPVSVRLGFDLWPMVVESSSGIESFTVSTISYENHNRRLDHEITAPAGDWGDLHTASINARRAGRAQARAHLTGPEPQRTEANACAMGHLCRSMATRVTLSAQIAAPCFVGTPLAVSHGAAGGDADEDVETLAVTRIRGYWAAGMPSPHWECHAVDSDGFAGTTRRQERVPRYSPAIVEAAAEAENRVKIRFPWDPDGVITPWLRMASPSWGPGHASYLPPQVGDTVLLMWGQQGVDPIVLGSLAAGDRIDAPGSKYVFESGTGHRVAIDDELMVVTNSNGGNTFARLEIGKDHLSAAVNEDVTIRITREKIELLHRTGGSLVISAEGIALESNGKIKLATIGGATIDMAGPKVSINGGALEVI